ncbi:hypothetical protein J6590_038256 [Homalodisca vitripennis]|nr:hypothetical protein J6590_038256 [Homalodisca vitripennis]
MKNQNRSELRSLISHMFGVCRNCSALPPPYSAFSSRSLISPCGWPVRSSSAWSGLYRERYAIRLCPVTSDDANRPIGTIT